MPAQIEGDIGASATLDILREATKWHYVCRAIEILTGGRAEKYGYEAAIALFVMKSWLSSSKPLIFAIKHAPSIFFCLILSDKINEIRTHKEHRYKRLGESLNSVIDELGEFFNSAVNEYDLMQTLSATFRRRNIVDYLINNTWRPHRSGVNNKKNKSEIDRLNKLTEYRLRLGNSGYNFGAKDASSLLGEMQSAIAWKPTTIKGIRSVWKEKEAFLFVGRTEPFCNVVSFNDLKIPELLQSIGTDAINHERNTSYFAKVKGIISDLTPETSKELEKCECWRRIENPGPPIPLEPFDDKERTRIDELGIKPTVRRSAEETKASGRQRPRSK